jgi:hypothetical protein
MRIQETEEDRTKKTESEVRSEVFKHRDGTILPPPNWEDTNVSNINNRVNVIVCMVTASLTEGIWHVSGLNKADMY